MSRRKHSNLAKKSPYEGTRLSNTGSSKFLSYAEGKLFSIQHFIPSQITNYI